jgi:hypothetical protein
MSRARGAALQLSRLRPGTTYVLGILRPYREYPLRQEELAAAWAALTNSLAPLPPIRNYTIIIGEAGGSPLFVDADDHPFRTHAVHGSAHFDIRMESWLPTDTIRRAGFGHVIVNRRHVLTLDRGMSFVALDDLDDPSLVIYQSGLLAPLPRLIPWAGAGRQ